MSNESRQRTIAACAVLTATVAVFWRTAYPTITWWDSSSYSLSAATLGVSSPPGSLVLTLVGWPVAQLFSGTTTAHALNLLAALIAALTAVLVGAIAREAMSLGRTNGLVASWPTTIGACSGVLAFAFSDTMWAYSVQFTPYVLTAFFTAAILFSIVRWWKCADQPHAWRWLALTALLFGVDFSVHRTNALLFPGFLICVAMRRPRTLREWRATLAGDIAIVLGLSLQLLVIPIAKYSHSPLNFSDPGNLSRFWDYVSLKQLGGSFLLQLLPRKSDVWSVQVADVFRMLGQNFLNFSTPFEVLGLVPAFAAVVGAAVLLRANKRLGAALMLVLVTQFVLTVVYFNIPRNYFRSFNRHYLPLCVTIAVFMAVGFASVAQWTSTHFRRGKFATKIAVAPVVLVFCLSPVAMLVGNWKTHDASKRFFAYDWALSALQGLPNNAIYFTAGDNDTFPLMYAQAVEGIRPDVAIINMSVAMMPGYTERMHLRDSTFPVSARMIPTEFVNSYTGPRPITYALTAVNSGIDLPSERMRMEGVFWRLTPQPNEKHDVDALRTALLQNTRYRGFADSSVQIDEETRAIAFQYYRAADVLLASDRANNDFERCNADLRGLFTLLPPERLGLDADFQSQLARRCEQ